MTTRLDVDRLGRAQAEVVRLARREMQGFFATMDLSTPARVRDALLEITPALVNAYGDVAAVAAAEWYEEVRAAQVGGSYSARLSRGVDPAAVESSVRYASGHLFDSAPEKTLALLNGSIQRLLGYSVRDTVRENVKHDPANPRWARVPTGATTCAFCWMLASRGFEYRTINTAGADMQYHNDCDCQLVVEFDAEKHHIEGYDPDALYAEYRRAANTVKSGNPREILARMRQMYPELSDGHVRH